MKQFSQKVNKSSRKEMTEFLTSHYRYNTMNSLNNSTSYAHCVKITRIGLNNEQMNRAWDMLQNDEVNDGISEIINCWARKHNYNWQVGFNGRSSGYIVLYQGGKHDDGRVFSYAGKGLDMDTDFSDWDMDSLKDRVELVQDFDSLVDEIVDMFVGYCNNFEVVEETVMVPQKIGVLKPVEHTIIPVATH